MPKSKKKPKCLIRNYLFEFSWLWFCSVAKLNGDTNGLD